MNNRQKLMAGLAAGMLAVLLVDRLYFSPWYEDMKKMGAEADRAKEQIAAAKATLRDSAAVKAEWKALGDGLSGDSDTLNDFMDSLNTLSGTAGLQNLSTKPGQERKIGEKREFTEYSVETSFQAGWESFVRLMLETRNAKEFVRVQRLAVASKYEKEGRLDVEFRVSTIGLAAPSASSAAGSGSGKVGAGRVERKLEDYKTLLENNIFSPPRPKTAPPKTDPPKPDSIMVTGFCWVGDHYEAVVKDVKKGEFSCKAGDSVGSWTVVSVGLDRMTVKNDGGERVVGVGEDLNKPRE